MWRLGLANDCCVREKGLEPSRSKAQEPKSCVSANFTTPASQFSVPVGEFGPSQKNFVSTCITGGIAVLLPV